MNIRILICLIIIIFLPAASAGTWDNVWVAKTSGYIDSNGSLSYEKYIIRATALDYTRASITVYKGQTKIETSDFNINDFKIYDSVGITLLGIKGERAWISISKLENKELWRQLTRKQLKWGETYAIENHTFNIDTFGSDSVNLTVSNSTVAETKALSKGGFKVYGTLGMTVADINRTGFIDIDFFTDKTPDFRTEVIPRISAQIQTIKDEYFPDEPIQVSIKIKSDFPINIAGATVESSRSVVIHPDSFSATDVTDELSFRSEITGQPANTTFVVRANIDVRDYLNNSYMLSASKDILVTPEVAVIKTVQADTDDETVPVHLDVYNSLDENISIHVHDAIPEELAAKELNWSVELAPKNSATFEYNVTPRKPGLYFLPAATAQWNGKSAVSRRAKMTMHMPYMSMIKTAVFKEGRTVVKLVSSNTGDRPAQVMVIDKIPDGAQAEGDTTWSGKLEGGESSTISYSLQGEIAALPPAGATYRDIRGVTREAQSNSVANTGGEAPEKKEETGTIPLSLVPNEIMTFMVSSFLAIAGIITGAALIAYLITRYGGKHNG